MSKIQCMANITSVTKLADGIFSMWLLAPDIAAQAAPGQFVSLYCRNEDRLLPRPISLCEIDREAGALRLVFRVAGAGTEEFSQMAPGQQIRVLGPLGNGFPCGEIGADGKALLIGGGIGIPPLLQLSKELSGDALPESYDYFCACGPLPMLRGIKEWGLTEHIPVWVSMEERMACGIGACLACVCQSTDVDEHSKVKNKRICKEGPVFLSTEIEF